MTGASEPTSVDRTLDGAARLYSRLAELRAVTKSIPVIGRALDTLLGERVDVLKTERFLKWLGLLRDILKELDEQKVDHAFLESEEFLALFMRTAKEAAECWQEEKIKVLAQFLANSTMIKGVYPGYRELVLSILSGLQMGHLVVLRDLARSTERRPGTLHAMAGVKPSPLTLSERFPGMTWEEILGFLVDLEAKGLAFRHGGHDIEAPDGRRDFPWSVATEQGFVVLDFIKEAASALSPAARP